MHTRNVFGSCTKTILLNSVDTCSHHEIVYFTQNAYILYTIICVYNDYNNECIILLSLLLLCVAVVGSEGNRPTVVVIIQRRRSLYRNENFPKLNGNVGNVLTINYLLQVCQASCKVCYVVKYILLIILFFVLFILYTFFYPFVFLLLILCFSRIM